MNLPNSITLVRILLIPVFVTLYLCGAYLAAVIVFILAAFTDFLDGSIARKYNLVTDLGKLLDPIADKVLVLSALFLLAYTQPFEPSYISAVFGLVIIARELLISIVRQVAASKGKVIQANIYGKLKTFTQTISLPLALLLPLRQQVCEISQTLFQILYYTAYITLIIAVLLTIMSGIVYLVQNKAVFTEDKKADQ